MINLIWIINQNIESGEEDEIPKVDTGDIQERWWIRKFESNELKHECEL